VIPASGIHRVQECGFSTRRPRPIYLDHHATTPVDPRVADVVYAVMTERFGNPNSVDHIYGEDATRIIGESAAHVAALVGAEPEDVRFTSSASDAIRLALAYALDRVETRPLRVAASRVEHAAVLETLASMKASGQAKLSWIEVDEAARVRPKALDAALAEGVDLVCLMAANNEVGTLQPITTAANRLRDAGADILVDATQAAGRIPLETRNWVSTISCSTRTRSTAPRVLEHWFRRTFLPCACLAAWRAMRQRPTHRPLRD
jgi:cysteine desulfurase